MKNYQSPFCMVCLLSADDVIATSGNLTVCEAYENDEIGLSYIDLF